MIWSMVLAGALCAAALALVVEILHGLPGPKAFGFFEGGDDD